MAHKAEFGCQHDLFSSSFQNLAQKKFVLAKTVDIGRVEKIDPRFNGAIDRLRRFIRINRAVDP
jgi:hypothetical protein